MATRLISKYNRYNLLLNFFVLLLGGICLVMIIRWALIRQLNQDLELEKEEIEEHVSQNNTLPSPMSFKGQIVSYEVVSETFEEKIKNEFFFEEEHHHKGKKFRAYRSLEFPIELDGKIYRCKILHSQAEIEDLIKIVAFSALGLGFLLFVVIILSNRFLFKKLWEPFQNTLRQLRQFKLSSQQNFVKTNTDIKEFQELNNVVGSMMELTKKEYNSLKDFTENASHEIQTPLAIIKSKLELLMQSGHIDNTESEYIESAYEASIRLSRLNQSLLLLTKIENNQYNNTENVSLIQITHHLTEQYQELMEAGHIELQTDFKKDAILKMDSALTEIMVGNLLRNAIRHNIDKGFIHIVIDGNKLQISNSGPSIQGSTDKLFERFQKESSSSKSLGLGLAIVLKIVQQYNFKINYDYKDSVHSITIDW